MGGLSYYVERIPRVTLDPEIDEHRQQNHPGDPPEPFLARSLLWAAELICDEFVIIKGVILRQIEVETIVDIVLFPRSRLWLFLGLRLAGTLRATAWADTDFRAAAWAYEVGFAH